MTAVTEWWGVGRTWVGELWCREGGEGKLGSRGGDEGKADRGNGDEGKIIGGDSEEGKTRHDEVVRVTRRWQEMEGCEVSDDAPPRPAPANVYLNHSHMTQAAATTATTTPQSPRLLIPTLPPTHACTLLQAPSRHLVMPMLQ